MVFNSLTLRNSVKYMDSIKLIARRMSSPREVKNICMAAANQIPLPIIPKAIWDPVSLSSGYPGIVLLFIELDEKFPNESWDSVVHDYILEIKACLEQGCLSNQASIFVGLAGVCFSLQKASKSGVRYKKMLDKLNVMLIEMIEKNHIYQLKDNFYKKQPSNPFLYDIIVGISGIAVYIFNNLQFPNFEKTGYKIASLLIQLTEKIHVNGNEVSGWYVSADQQLMKREKDEYPNGCFNMGFSHGISGVLAALSLAYEKGIQIENQKNTILKLATWIIQYRKTVGDRCFWPPYISFEEAAYGFEAPVVISRDAWCYGAPGISRALLLAAKAINCKFLKKTAFEMFDNLLNQRTQKWNAYSPTFCHGLSGLAQLTYSMSLEASPREKLFLIERYKEFADLIFEGFDEDLPFGFQDIETQIDGSKWKISKAGLLEGSAGILLTLLNPELNSPGWSSPLFC